MSLVGPRPMLPTRPGSIRGGPTMPAARADRLLADLRPQRDLLRRARRLRHRLCPAAVAPDRPPGARGHRLGGGARHRLLSPPGFGPIGGTPASRRRDRGVLRGMAFSMRLPNGRRRRPQRRPGAAVAPRCFRRAFGPLLRRRRWRSPPATPPRSAPRRTTSGRRRCSPRATPSGRWSSSATSSAWTASTPAARLAYASLLRARGEIEEALGQYLRLVEQGRTNLAGTSGWSSWRSRSQDFATAETHAAGPTPSPPTTPRSARSRPPSTYRSGETEAAAAMAAPGAGGDPRQSDRAHGADRSGRRACIART